MNPHRPSWNVTELLEQSAWVRRLALQLVSDAAQVDELVQETLLAAIERRPGSHRPLRPWLGQVLRNRIAFWRRGEAHRKEREAVVASQETLPSTEELQEQAETQRMVVDALGTLRDPYRSVLLLRYYEGLEPAEIARRQDLNPATVRSQLKRGLEELRRAMELRFEEDDRRWALALVPLAAGAEPLSSTPSAISVASAAVAGILVSATAWVFLQPSAESKPKEKLVETGAEETTVVAPIQTGTTRAAASPANARRSTGAGALHSIGAQALVGILRDYATGSPLGEYAISVDDGESEELVWTDSEGRFESERAYPAGQLVLGYVDHPEIDGLIHTGRGVITFGQGVKASLNWDPAKSPVELQVTTGPSYQTRIEAPFSLSGVELQATLRVPRPAFGDALEWSVRAPVRGNGQWIRFHPLHGAFPLGRTWHLHVQTDDGLWADELEVTGGDGVYPEVLHFELTEHAALDVDLIARGTLRNPDVTLERASDGERQVLFGESKVENGDELVYGFTRGALVPGSYDVLVRVEGYERPTESITLVAGERHRRRFPISTAPETSHIAGELRSSSGTLREPVTLYLTGNDKTHLSRPAWKQIEGRWVAPFEFVNLPPGEYALRLETQRSYHRWSPSSLKVDPPADGLVLLCRDDEPAVDLDVFVHFDGGPVTLPSVYLDVAGSPTPNTGLGGRARSGAYRSLYASVPLDAELSWFVWSEGYAPAFGDEADVQLQGEKGVLEVVLTPGWGAKLQTLVEGAPLPRVEVSLDGTLVGTTDARGEIVLRAANSPERIELKRAGHLFALGDYDPDAGRLLGDGGVHVLHFRRRQ